MEVQVTVSRRYTKDGPIEMVIQTNDKKARAAALLTKDFYGKNVFTLSTSAEEIEYIIPLLEVVKNEYEKIIQERKGK